MRYLFIIFSLLVIDQLNAQDCNNSFFGEVIDLHLNEGLSGAKVTIDNNSFVVSNLKGEFSIEGICEGEHELTISHPNCKVITVNIDIPRIGAKKIYLEHHITELEEIIVSSNSNRKESLTSIEDVIDREKILDFKSKNPNLEGEKTKKNKRFSTCLSIFYIQRGRKEVGSGSL